MIEHVKDLVDVGIDSLKIEGRMKSAYYTALVSNAYRIALGDVEKNLVPTSELLKELESVSHREFCTGYFYDREMAFSQIASSSGYIGEQSFLCSVLEEDSKNNWYVCRQKNKFAIGDICEFITPGKTGQEITILSMTDEHDHPIDYCPHPQMIFKIKTDKTLRAGDLIRKKQ
jgi:putative protease